jgi:hypothetical protein
MLSLGLGARAFHDSPLIVVCLLTSVGKFQGSLNKFGALELLVQTPCFSDIDRGNKFYSLLSTFPHLEWVASTLQIADTAAQLRDD